MPGFLAQRIQRHVLGQIAERPFVVLVAEAGHQLLVKRLAGTGLLQALTQPRGLAAQALLSSRIQHPLFLRRVPIPPLLLARWRSAAGGKRVGGEVNILEGKAGRGREGFPQGDPQRTGRQFILLQRSAEVGDMEAHPGVARIAGVAVPTPILGMDVHLDIAGHPAPVGSHPRHRTQEIGSRVQVPDPRILHDHLLAFEAVQDGRSQPRIEPDTLQVAFTIRKGRRRRAIFLHPAGPDGVAAVTNGPGKQVIPPGLLHQGVSRSARRWRATLTMVSNMGGWPGRP